MDNRFKEFLLRFVHFLESENCKIDLIEGGSLVDPEIFYKISKNSEQIVVKSLDAPSIHRYIPV